MTVSICVSVFFLGVYVGGQICRYLTRKLGVYHAGKKFVLVPDGTEKDERGR